MSDCIFCKIINREIPSTIVYENEDILGFKDISPKAPHHLLFIPKKHIAKVSDSTQDDILLLGKIIYAAKEYAEQIGLSEKGYRLVFNNGEGAGQAVFHIHLHLLGGRTMSWPPG